MDRFYGIGCVTILTLALLVLSSAFLDSYVSTLPYNKTLKVFYGETSFWCRFLYELVPIIVALIIVSCGLLFIFKSKLPFNKNMTNRFIVITLVSMLVGPGIICNSILKKNWGRPRPYQVLRDNQEFRPFYKPDFAKPQFNSFPSGHATIGFFLGVPLLVLGKRKLGLITGLFGGMIIGIVRLLQGGHYVSDILFSGIIVWIVTELVMYLYDNKFAGKVT